MKIGFLADIHLKSMGSRVDPKTGLNARMVDIADTVHMVADEMVEQGVDTAVFLGDAFKNAKPTPTMLRLLGDALAPLKNAGISIEWVVGNHDLARGGVDIHALWPMSWYSATPIEDTPHIVTQRDCTLLVVPYPNVPRIMAGMKDRPETSDDLYKEVRSIVVEQINQLANDGLSSDNPMILCAHMALDEAESGTESSYMLGRDFNISIHDIPATVQLAFFGHVHKPQEFRLAGGRKAYVVGSPERESFSEEGELKRWMMLDTETMEASDFPTGARIYQTFVHDVTDGFTDLGFESYGSVEGKIVRVKYKAKHGQHYPTTAVRRQLMDAGAFEVTFTPEWVRADRESMEQSQGAEMASLDYDALFGAFLDGKGYTGTKKSRIIQMGKDDLREALA